MIPENVQIKLEGLKLECLKNRNILYYDSKRKFAEKLYSCKTPDEIWNLKRWDVLTVMTKEPDLICEKTLGELYPVLLMVQSDAAGSV